jgi:hypothetical protein
VPDAWLLYGLLGLICACLLLLTATALLLAHDLRRTLRQVSVLVRHSNQAVTGARRILARAEVATGRINRIVAQACAAAEGAMGGLTKLLGNGNGAGEGPRSRYRR